MSEFRTYSDAEVDQFLRVLDRHPIFEVTSWWVRDVLRQLSDAGITVDFPLPAYQCDRYAVHAVEGWAVRDTDEYRVKAWYSDDLANAEHLAFEHADRLNRKAQP